MKTSICAIIKNEQRFLKEWIEWHLNIGFDAIHLFEDKDSISHEFICNEYDNVFLRRYENDIEVQKILNSNGSSVSQLSLYNWFGDTYKSIYDWVAFIDIDEFITFADNYDLKQLCNEFEPHSCVLLSWKIMGASGHIKRPTCGVVEAYTQEEKPIKRDTNYLFKSMCNLNRWKGMSSSLHVANGFVNTNHNTNKNERYYNKAWINHYFSKSWEDWCDRIYLRGGTQQGHRLLYDFFLANPSMNHLADFLIKSKLQDIPNGTYRVEYNKGLIAGGNIKKITKLNNSIYFEPADYIGKNILIIGNKPVEQLSDDAINYINSFDIIIRSNGMNNLNQTGGRVDWWWLNVWNWETLKNNLGDRDYSGVSIIFTDKNSERLVTKSTIFNKLAKIKNNVLQYFTKQDSSKLFNQEKHWIIDKKSTVPTTDVICLSYFVNTLKAANIHLACLDIDEREQLFKTHPNWANTWHKNVGGLEAKYIKELIENKMIKYVELK